MCLLQLNYCNLQFLKDKVNEEAKEECPDIGTTEKLSDGSNSEDTDSSEEKEAIAEEKQETETRSCDVPSIRGGNDEFKSENSDPVYSEQHVEEMATICKGATAVPRHMITEQGIFGGRLKYREDTAGPLITEIVTAEGDLNACVVSSFPQLALKIWNQTS